MSKADQLAAAAILAERRRSDEQGARLPPSCRPTDLDVALAIQSAVVSQLGERIAAWKCGLPNAGQVILAPIHAGTVQTSSPCRVSLRSGKARVEPELAFVLGRDLPAREAAYTPAEINAAIARTHLALELIGSRFRDDADASFAENMADGLFNQGLFIGPQVNDEQARAASDMKISITRDDRGVTELEGHHPAVDPRAPLYWLAEFLRSKGRGLKAGQTVITGSYAGVIDLPPGEDIAIRFGDLGTLNVRFERK